MVAQIAVLKKMVCQHKIRKICVLRLSATATVLLIIGNVCAVVDGAFLAPVILVSYKSTFHIGIGCPYTHAGTLKQ